MAAKPDLQVNIHEAKTHFSRYVARVQAGDTVVIAKAGKPVAKLVAAGDPPPKAKRPSILGAMREYGPIDDDAFRAMDKEVEAMFLEAAEKPL